MLCPRDRKPFCSRSRCLFCLFRIVHDFDAVHARHPLNGYKSEQNLALCVGSNPGKVPVYRPTFSTGLLHDIEASQQGHTVAVDVKDPTAGPAHAAVALSVVAFTEFQRDSIPAFRHGHSVGKMCPNARSRRVPCPVRSSCSPERDLSCGPTRFRPGNRSRPATPASAESCHDEVQPARIRTGFTFPRTDRQHLDSTQHRCASHRAESSGAGIHPRPVRCCGRPAHPRCWNRPHPPPHRRQSGADSRWRRRERHADPRRWIPR